MDPNNEKILSHLENQLKQEESKFKIEEPKKINNFLEPEVRIGYMEIFLENLPTKKLFYPKDARLFIRAARGEEIKTWSMIDETDPLSVTEGLNSVLSNCIDYIPQSGKKGNWKDIKDEDKFALILKIRDMTFPEPENKLKVSTNCLSPISNEKCELPEIEIKSDNLDLFDNDLEEVLEKYYDVNQRCYNVKTKQGDFILTAPSIGTMITINNYTKKIRQESKKEFTDAQKSFYSILPYLENDWRNLSDNRIKELEVDYISWSVRKIAVFLKLVEKMKMGPNLKLKQVCGKCGLEVKAPISFRGGFKNIFSISDLDSELL